MNRVMSEGFVLQYSYPNVRVFVFRERFAGLLGAPNGGELNLSNAKVQSSKLEKQRQRPPTTT